MAAVTNYAYGRVVNLVAKKLKAQGITLGPRDAARLKRLCATGKLAENFHLRDSLPKQRGNVVVRITPEDTAALGRYLDRLVDTARASLPQTMNETAQGILQTLQDRWSAHRRNERRASKEFSARLEDRWGLAFEQAAMLVVTCTELGGAQNARLRGVPSPCPDTNLVNVVSRLHARACQVAGEILGLLRLGFADGAIARWRTLHELAVVGFVLTRHGDEAAKRFIEHQSVESARAAKDYEWYAKRLKVAPLAEGLVASLEAKRNKLRDRYGKRFDGPYGWADGFVQRDPKRGQLGFQDLEVDAHIDHLRPYYRLASHSVHANPNGTFYRLGLTRESEYLLTGPSPFGLSDPGQSMAISLGQITVTFCNIAPTVDTVVATKVVQLQGETVQKSFADADVAQRRAASPKKVGV